jgi:Di-haem cytochrome c peroxidase
VRVDIEFAGNLAVYENRHNDFGLGLQRASEIAGIGVDIVDDNGFAGRSGGAANTLVERNAGVRGHRALEGSKNQNVALGIFFEHVALALLFLCLSSPVFAQGNLQSKSNDLQAPPGLPPIPWPEGNGYSPSRVELGKILFFDGRLSANGVVSCAFCHEPSHAFSGSTALSSGVNGKLEIRHTPTLINRLG